MPPIVTAVQLMRLRGEDPDLVARSVEVIDRQTQHMTRLVDDLLDVSRITRGTISLREESFALTTVVQGAVEQARPLIQEAGRLHPEIVLLDIGLPDIDGHEVARRLRTQTSLRSSLLVALTGYGQERDRQLSREAGFDHHLVKPVDLGKLEGLLKIPS